MASWTEATCWFKLDFYSHKSHLNVFFLSRTEGMSPNVPIIRNSLSYSFLLNHSYPMKSHCFGTQQCTWKILKKEIMKSDTFRLSFCDLMVISFLHVRYKCVFSNHSSERFFYHRIHIEMISLHELMKCVFSNSFSERKCSHKIDI